nr:photosystem II protein L [Rheum pumilum]QHF16952.1 photosystem II protein L [Bougainvillea spectabilis]QKQ12328.1 photosystem II protein L [Rheum officinale]QKQ12664.1 photosystem II protein L [Rheum tanguticum]WDW27899.1 photosystem II protein L [Rheum palmatum]QZJ45682.1 photosystem II protein L [Rheum pumilum]
MELRHNQTRTNKMLN